MDILERLLQSPDWRAELSEAYDALEWYTRGEVEGCAHEDVIKKAREFQKAAKRLLNTAPEQDEQMTDESIVERLHERGFHVEADTLKRRIPGRDVYVGSTHHAHYQTARQNALAKLAEQGASDGQH